MRRSLCETSSVSLLFSEEFAAEFAADQGSKNKWQNQEILQKNAQQTSAESNDNLNTTPPEIEVDKVDENPSNSRINMETENVLYGITIPITWLSMKKVLVLLTIKH